MTLSSADEAKLTHLPGGGGADATGRRVSQPALLEHVARLCGARAAVSRDESAHYRGART